MSKEDALHWNLRYQNPESWLRPPRKWLCDHLDLLPHTGCALDLAMGIGADAHVLLDHGLRVIGIDISINAVKIAKKLDNRLDAVNGDMTNIFLPDASFDVICNFYYLQRNLWNYFSRIIKPGGWLLFETLTQPMRSIKSDLDPEKLLSSGELTEYFKNWEIVSYFEGWTISQKGNQKAVASLLARFPDQPK